MTKSKDSLFDIAPKTLDESQISNAITRFKEVTERFTKLPQVELVDDSKDYKHLALKFISLSKAGNFRTPVITITERESCKNMETVKSIDIDADDCGTCSGGSHANFNNKNISKMEQVLVNVEALFERNYNEAMKQDKVELEFNKVIEKVDSLMQVKYIKESEDPDLGYYEREKLGSVNGEVTELRDDKTFNVELKHLTFKQVETLSKVIPNF